MAEEVGLFGFGRTANILNLLTSVNLIMVSHIGSYRSMIQTGLYIFSGITLVTKDLLWVLLDIYFLISSAQSEDTAESKLYR